MQIATAIRHRVGAESMRSDRNAVRNWLHATLGEDVCKQITELMRPAGLGEIECLVTQLAESCTKEDVQ